VRGSRNIAAMILDLYRHGVKDEDSLLKMVGAIR
jgi:hypothetical protein